MCKSFSEHRLFFLGEILGVELLEDMFSPAKGVWFCTSSSIFGIFDLLKFLPFLIRGVRGISLCFN